MSRRTGAAAVVAVVVYAAMWIGYRQDWAWIAAMDDWFLDAFASIGAENPAWVTSWLVFCTVFGPMVFRAVGVVVIIWLLVRRHLRPALFLVVCLELSGLVTQTAKLLADRPRPETEMVPAFSSSFPSGHALGVLVGVLAFLTLLLPAVDTRWHKPLIIAGTALVVLIGIGRVVLNVHHPSDVLAGWALGYLWYLVCVPLLRPATAEAGKPAVPGNGHGS